MTPVRIPPTLREQVGGERQVEADGETVRELLDDLMSRFPSLRPQLVEDDELAPLILLPAMAGGAPCGNLPDPLPRSASGTRG